MSASKNKSLIDFLVMTIIGLVVIIATLINIVFDFKNSFDKMADRYEKHLDSHGQIYKTQ